MNNVAITRVYAVLVGALAVVGLFVSGHMFNLMNSDVPIDLLRVVLAIYLIYAGFIARNERVARTALLVVGILYIVMAIIGLASPTLGGILPTGLTGFDIVFHLATGALATIVGMRHGQRSSAAHA